MYELRVIRLSHSQLVDSLILLVGKLSLVVTCQFANVTSWQIIARKSTENLAHTACAVCMCIPSRRQSRLDRERTRGAFLEPWRVKKSHELFKIAGRTVRASVILIRGSIFIFQWAPRRNATSIVVDRSMNRRPCFLCSIGQTRSSDSSGKRKPASPVSLVVEKGRTRTDRHGGRGCEGVAEGRKGRENGEEWKRRGRRFVERSVFTTSQNNRVKENVLLLVNGIVKQHRKTLQLDDAIEHGE